MPSQEKYTYLASNLNCQCGLCMSCWSRQGPGKRCDNIKSINPQIANTVEHLPFPLDCLERFLFVFILLQFSYSRFQFQFLCICLSWGTPCFLDLWIYIFINSGKSIISLNIDFLLFSPSGTEVHVY